MGGLMSGDYGTLNHALMYMSVSNLRMKPTHMETIGYMSAIAAIVHHSWDNHSICKVHMVLWDGRLD